jgi:misacylated tRNA(Ala) deacylase
MTAYDANAELAGSPTAGSEPSDSLPVTERGSEHVDPRSASHSAEHILNAVMQRDFGTGRSVEVHFGEKKTKVDYCVPRPLREVEVREIEAAVNAEIAKDHPVTSFVVPRAEAERRYDMGKVPAAADPIRIVQIGDLDAIPCVGEHVERTSEIGRFEIRSAEMRGDDRIRIRFRLRDRPKGAA